MKTILLNYPGLMDIKFRLFKDLKTHEERTHHVQHYLRIHDVDIPNHEPEDMVVEGVYQITSKIEEWILGS